MIPLLRELYKEWLFIQDDNDAESMLLSSYDIARMNENFIDWLEDNNKLPK